MYFTSIFIIHELKVFCVHGFPILVGVSMVSGQERCRDLLDPNGCNPEACNQQCVQKHKGGVGECWPRPNICTCTFLCWKP